MEFELVFFEKGAFDEEIGGDVEGCGVVPGEGEGHFSFFFYFLFVRGKNGGGCGGSDGAWAFLEREEKVGRDLKEMGIV